jgi:hypothetical protein
MSYFSGRNRRGCVDPNKTMRRVNNSVTAASNQIMDSSCCLQERCGQRWNLRTYQKLQLREIAHRPRDHRPGRARSAITCLCIAQACASLKSPLPGTATYCEMKRGSSIRIHVAPPSSRIASSFPPCASMIERLMARATTVPRDPSATAVSRRPSKSVTQPPLS